MIENGSGAETVAWIREQYPRVRLVDLGENRGVVARNEGFRHGTGEIVVTIDNDVYFDSPETLARIAEAFERHPAAACIAFRVCHPATGRLHVRDWCHPRPWQQAQHLEFETTFITEGAAAFRRAVFDRIEPYWEQIFIGHEGFDLGLRLLDAGYEIWYTPTVTVWHMASPETRENWRPFYFNSRNLILVLARQYPLGGAIRHALPRLVILGFYALRYGHLWRFFQGIGDGLREIPEVRRIRKPLDRRTLRKFRHLTRENPGLVTRFLRHWRRHEF